MSDVRKERAVLIRAYLSKFEDGLKASKIASQFKWTTREANQVLYFSDFNEKWWTKHKDTHIWKVRGDIPAPKKEAEGVGGGPEAMVFLHKKENPVPTNVVKKTKDCKQHGVIYVQTNRSENYNFKNNVKERRTDVDFDDEENDLVLLHIPLLKEPKTTQNKFRLFLGICYYHNDTSMVKLIDSYETIEQCDAIYKQVFTKRQGHGIWIPKENAGYPDEGQWGPKEVITHPVVRVTEFYNDPWVDALVVVDQKSDIVKIYDI
jgi:hypothetical protein